jgi:hypothetical protein
MQLHTDKSMLPMQVLTPLEIGAKDSWGDFVSYVDRGKGGKSRGLAVFERALVYCEGERSWDFPLSALASIGFRARRMSLGLARDKTGIHSPDAAGFEQLGLRGVALHDHTFTALGASLEACGVSFDGLAAVALERFVEQVPVGLIRGWAFVGKAERSRKLQDALDALYALGRAQGLDEAPEGRDGWAMIPLVAALAAELRGTDALRSFHELTTRSCELTLEAGAQSFEDAIRLHVLGAILAPFLAPGVPRALRHGAAAVCCCHGKADLQEALVVLAKAADELEPEWLPALELLRQLGRSELDGGKLGQPDEERELLREALSSVPEGLVSPAAQRAVWLTLEDSLFRAHGKRAVEGILERLDEAAEHPVATTAELAIALYAITALAQKLGRKPEVQRRIVAVVESAHRQLGAHPLLRVVRRLLTEGTGSLSRQLPAVELSIDGLDRHFGGVTATAALSEAAGGYRDLTAHYKVSAASLEAQSLLEPGEDPPEIEGSGDEEFSPLGCTIAAVVAIAVLAPFVWMSAQLVGPCGLGFGGFFELFSDEVYGCLDTTGDVAFSIHGVVYLILFLAVLFKAWAETGKFFASALLAGLAVAAWNGLLWIPGALVAWLFLG